MATNKAANAAVTSGNGTSGNGTTSNAAKGGANRAIETLEIAKEELIAASVEIVFETLLEQVGADFETAEGAPLPMKLEAWPGGRWYRDLGGSSGHLWGHVQVIKPPTLLEICGPLCMSYPAVSHLQYRLNAEGDATRLTLLHRAFGQLRQDHCEGMPHGFAFHLQRVRAAAERRK